MKVMYHGTPVGDIEALDISRCSESSPFGRAIYLTEDPLVADCYVRKSGSLLQVAVDGDWDSVLDFDRTLEQQSAKAQEIIKK